MSRALKRRHPEPAEGFSFETQVSVRPPYRLDLTVDALRRLAANVVDVVADDGVYRRALRDGHGTNLLEVRQASAQSLHVRLSGRNPQRWIPAVERMLGTHVRLDEWYRRVRPYPWLAFVARELRGLRPPRYPSLWEALAHAIVFQQISIHAAASIMRRLVEAAGEPVPYAGGTYYAFVTARELLECSDPQLRGAGLSANKIAHLRSAADAVESGAVDEGQLERLPSAQASERLCSIRGIGPWSAAVVLLRGFGRLDVFPMKDSGVARSLRLLSGNPLVDAHALLEGLGPVRGMLYFHLLLGRMRNLVPSTPDSEVT
jgi:DNA-3-methyladenine glycosylase II